VTETTTDALISTSAAECCI